MKICWDNLENLRYSQRTGKWYRKTETFIYKDECKICKEPFLIEHRKQGNFCSSECFHKNGRSKKHKENISKD